MQLRLALFVAFAMVGCAGASPQPEHADNAHPLLGSVAPSFKRAAAYGPSGVSSDAARGKIMVIDFWATYCEPCARSFPKLQAIAERFPRDAVLYGVSEDDEASEIGPFVRKTGAKFPIAWDEGKVIGQKYRLEKMPTTVVVDRKGIVRYVHGGYYDGEEAELSREIEHLAGPSPSGR